MPTLWGYTDDSCNISTWGYASSYGFHALLTLVRDRFTSRSIKDLYETMMAEDDIGIDNSDDAYTCTNIENKYKVADSGG